MNYLERLEALEEKHLIRIIEIQSKLSCGISKLSLKHELEQELDEVRLVSVALRLLIRQTKAMM